MQVGVRSFLVVGVALATGCFNPHYGSPGFYCDVDAGETCPSGQTCSAIGQCVDDSGGTGKTLSVMKTSPYITPTSDPHLDSETDCTDSPLEPNDSTTQATAFPAIQIDGNPVKLVMLAICPTGPNPKAKFHDVDTYQINVPSATNALVNIAYDIQFGDLDLGIFKADGTVVASDGTSVSNACVSTPLSAGLYYIGVVGAMSQDVNRYTMTVKYSSSAGACSTTSTPTPDGGV